MFTENIKFFISYLKKFNKGYIPSILEKDKEKLIKGYKEIFIENLNGDPDYKLSVKKECFEILKKKGAITFFLNSLKEFQKFVEDYTLTSEDIENCHSLDPLEIASINIITALEKGDLNVSKWLIEKEIENNFKLQSLNKKNKEENFITNKDELIINEFIKKYSGKNNSLKNIDF